MEGFRLVGGQQSLANNAGINCLLSSQHLMLAGNPRGEGRRRMKTEEEEEDEEKWQ